MDVPILLEKEHTLEGVEEVKQAMIALFQNEKGSWNQGAKVGCVGVIHTVYDPIALELYVDNVAQQVGAKVLSIQDLLKYDGTVELMIVIEFDNQRLALRYDGEEWQ